MGKRGPKPGQGGRPRKYPIVQVIPPPPKQEDDLSLFEKFLNIVRGKTDVKSRVRMLLDPDNPETSTYLTRTEVDFVSTAHFVASEFPMFEPLSDFATEFELAKISETGHGVESVIRYEAAINESKPSNQFSFGLTPSTPQKEGKEKGKEAKV